MAIANPAKADTPMMIASVIRNEFGLLVVLLVESIFRSLKQKVLSWLHLFGTLSFCCIMSCFYLRERVCVIIVHHLTSILSSITYLRLSYYSCNRSSSICVYYSLHHNASSLQVMWKGWFSSISEKTQLIQTDEKENGVKRTYLLYQSIPFKHLYSMVKCIRYIKIKLIVKRYPIWLS